MLYLVPLAGAGWQMTDRDWHLELVSQLLKLDFPQAHTIAVAAAAIGGDHQPCGFGMAFLSHGPPPSADGVDGEAGGVVIGADADPSDIVGNVVDAVRYGAGELGVDEVVDVDLFGLALGVRFPAVVLEIAHQFLLFGIGRDDRLLRRQERLGLLVDVVKLRVAIDVLAAFPCLAVRLQAVAEPAQKIADNRGADFVPLPGKLSGKRTQASARPQQGPDRVAPCRRCDQRSEIGHKRGIRRGFGLAPGTRPAHTSGRSRELVPNVRHSAVNGGARQTTDLRHRTHPAMAQQPGLQRHKPPSALLIQHRRHLPIASSCRAHLQ